MQGMRLLALGRVRKVVYMSGYHEGRVKTGEWPLVPKPFAVRDLLEVVGRTLTGTVAAAADPSPGRSA